MSAVLGRIPRSLPVRGLLIGVVILALGGALFAHLAPRQVPCGHRVSIKVVSSTEKDTLLQNLAGSYNESKNVDGSPYLVRAGTTCAQVSVVGVTSGIAEEILSGNTTDPTITSQLRREMQGAQVWTPSSRLWLQRLQLDAPKRAPDPASAQLLAKSPLVLAMPAALAAQLHWDTTPPTWAQAMTALKSGKVNYAQDNPRYSTSGTLATLLTYGAATAGSGKVRLADFGSDTLKSPAVTAFVHGVQGAARGGFVNDSTDILRSWVTSAALPPNTMLLIQDQMAWGYDSGQYNPTAGGQPSVPLVVVQPRMAGSTMHESLVADHPYATLPGATATQRAAAADFYSYVKAKANWTSSFCKAGFHDSAGHPPALACPSATLPASVGQTDLSTDFNALPLPGVAVQEQMVDQWLKMRSPRRILIAMDVSGSMQKQRLADAVQAVKGGIALLRPQDQVEVVQFAGTASFQRPHWTVLPLQAVGDGKTLANRLTALDQTPTSAQRQETGVLTTVNDVYRKMSGWAAQDPASKENAPLNAVIVLSDGIDEWRGGAPATASAATVCASWKSIPHVPIYTVHYNPDQGEPYTKAQIDQGRANLATLASCTTPQGLTIQSDERAHPLDTIFSQVMGAL